MTIRNVLLALAGVSAIVHVTSYIMIMVDLDRRGYKTNIFLARIFFGAISRPTRRPRSRSPGSRVRSMESASRPS